MTAARVTTGLLGYSNTDSIGDDETPGSAGPVDLEAGRTARAVTAGGNHTCALRNNGTVLCWGDGVSGELGYRNVNDIGDDETPGSVGPLSLGGVMVASIGDLSLAMSTDAAARPVGQDVRFTLTLVNAGLDTADEVAVDDRLPAGLLFLTASASQGAYAPGSGRWTVGAVAPGATASLTLRARVDVAGMLTNVAEVAASRAFDEDSTPANGVAGEDDRAEAQITGTTVASAGGSKPRPRPRSLTLKVTPRRDRRVPLRFTASGRLTAPASVPASAACRGKVTVTFRRGRKLVARRTAKLRRRHGRCVYRTRRTFRGRKSIGRKTRKLTVGARFAGNQALRARAAKRVRVRVR